MVWRAMRMSKHQVRALARRAQPPRPPTQTLTHTHTQDTLSFVSPFFYLHCLHIAQLCLSRSLIPRLSHLFQGCLAAHGSSGGKARFCRRATFFFFLFFEQLS